MLARDNAMTLCPCVCLSQVEVLSKRINGLSLFFLQKGFPQLITHCVIGKFEYRLFNNKDGLHLSETLFQAMDFKHFASST